MKVLRLSCLLSAAISLVAPLSSYASDGTISFSGTLNASTCTVSSGTSGSFAVPLPSVATSSVTGLGTTGGNTSFSIAITGCTGGSTATAFFEPGAYLDASTGHLKTATGAGAAANVELQLQNSDTSAIDLSKPSGSQNVAAATISSNQATANFIAVYYATGVTTAGTVNSSVTYSMIYN
jgi:major type 1 subunit fimbrin (pilin)